MGTIPSLGGTPPETTNRLFSLIKIVSDVNVTAQTLLHKVGRTKVLGCHGIIVIVHPVMKKLPHPQVGSNCGIDILNPKARQHWMLPLGNLKPLLNTVAYCVQMMYARLYGYCSWLIKFSVCRPLLHLTRIPSQFSFLWVGSLVSIPNSLGMRLVGQTVQNIC